jgi:hypothetical protein
MAWLTRCWLVNGAASITSCLAIPPRAVLSCLCSHLSAPTFTAPNHKRRWLGVCRGCDPIAWPKHCRVQTQRVPPRSQWLASSDMSRATKDNAAHISAGPVPCVCRRSDIDRHKCPEAGTILQVPEAQSLSSMYFFKKPQATGERWR